jgi:hypothetical protein
MTVANFHTLTRQPEPARKPLSLSLLIGMLAALAVACLAMIVPPMFGLANDAGGERQALFRCAIVDGAGDRLACYDRIGSETLQPPAKGANAPLGLGVKDIFSR